MPNSNQLPSNVVTNLQNTPWGDVFPPKDNPNPLTKDGRTIALETLRDYICALRFFRPNAPGQPPIPFQIDPAQFFIEWPDSIQQMNFPSIAVVHSRAIYDVIGLTTYIEEDTKDVYGPGTVVQWQSEYVETIQLEIWVAKKAERRSILSGIETALSPTEQMSGVRFKMPNYYNELVCFTLNDREIIDEPDSPKNRRRAQLGIEVRFNVVALVNYREMIPVVTTNTDVQMDSQTPIDISNDPNARFPDR